jgi:hypothetical protein
MGNFSLQRISLEPELILTLLWNMRKFKLPQQCLREQRKRPLSLLHRESNRLISDKKIQKYNSSMRGVKSPLTTFAKPVKYVQYICKTYTNVKQELIRNGEKNET